MFKTFTVYSVLGEKRTVPFTKKLEERYKAYTESQKERQRICKEKKINNFEKKQTMNSIDKYVFSDQYPNNNFCKFGILV